MIVRILKEIEYAPTPEDSRRCWGQLRLRPSEMQIEVPGAEGEPPTTKTVHGPMVRFFKVGATPELSDQVALQMIADGVAEVYADDIRYVSQEEIARDIKVEATII